MQDTVVVPHVQVTGPELDAELEVSAAQHVLVGAVRRPRPLELRIRHQQRARQVGMPTHAPHPTAAGSQSHCRVDAGLVHGRVVVRRDAAADDGGGGEGRGELGRLRAQRLERSERAHERVDADALEPVPALHADRVGVVGVVAVREEELRGVVVGQAGAAGGVRRVVRGHVEGPVGAAERVHEDGAEEALERRGDEGVGLGALERHVRRGRGDDAHDSGAVRVQQVVEDGEVQLGSVDGPRCCPDGGGRRRLVQRGDVAPADFGDLQLGNSPPACLLSVVPSRLALGRAYLLRHQRSHCLEPGQREVSPIACAPGSEHALPPPRVQRRASVRDLDPCRRHAERCCGRLGRPRVAPRVVEPLCVEAEGSAAC